MYLQCLIGQWARCKHNDLGALHYAFSVLRDLIKTGLSVEVCVSRNRSMNQRLWIWPKIASRVIPEVHVLGNALAIDMEYIV